MAAVEVVPLGDFKTFDIEFGDRFDHRMHGKLVIEKLIELTVDAAVIIGAGSKFDATLHGVQTGLFPGRQIPEPVLPGYDAPSGPPGRDSAFPQHSVFFGNPLQCFVVAAGRALIVMSAVF
jgi:hypothetical protein